VNEISFEVDGFPPAKNEALSMLGPAHPHAARVIRLLQAAQLATSGSGFRPFAGPIGLKVTLYAPTDQHPWDATNYLGGIADVLEDKSKRGILQHLQNLHHVALYPNDRQIREVHYRQMTGPAPRYRVGIWELSD
jgi:hypothetical protein